MHTSRNCGKKAGNQRHRLISCGRLFLHRMRLCGCQWRPRENAAHPVSTTGLVASSTRTNCFQLEQLPLKNYSNKYILNVSGIVCTNSDMVLKHILYQALLCHLIATAKASTMPDTNSTQIPLSPHFFSSPNSRDTLDFLWSSMFTLVACTWTIQHFNVPDQRSITSLGW